MRARKVVFVSEVLRTAKDNSFSFLYITSAQATLKCFQSPSKRGCSPPERARKGETWLRHWPSTLQGWGLRHAARRGHPHGSHSPKIYYHTCAPRCSRGRGCQFNPLVAFALISKRPPSCVTACISALATNRARQSTPGCSMEKAENYRSWEVALEGAQFSAEV
jgi:hypothetical protein